MQWSQVRMQAQELARAQQMDQEWKRVVQLPILF